MSSAIKQEYNLKDLKCIKCGLFLSVPPIKINKNGDSICGRCEENAGIRNKSYEILASTMDFPCRYNSYGCEYTPKWDKVEQHEQLCDFRQFKCPLAFTKTYSCPWSGRRKNIYQHCRADHVENVSTMHPFITQYKLCSDIEKCILMNLFGSLFLIQVKINKTLDKILHCVRYIGNPKCISQYYFTLKISKNSTGLTDIIPIFPYEESVQWEEQALDLQLSGIEIILKGDENISCMIMANRKINFELLDEVKCMICKYYCKHTILHIDGNAVCKHCAPANCLKEPDLTSLGFQLLYPCKQRSKGCYHFDNVKSIWKHEIFACKFFECFICNKTFESSLEDHFKAKHSAMISSFEEMIYIDLKHKVHWVLITNFESNLLCQYSFDEEYLNIFVCTNLTNEELNDSTCGIKIFDFNLKKTVYKNMAPVENHVFDWRIELHANDLFSTVNNDRINIQFELFKTVCA